MYVNFLITSELKVCKVIEINVSIRLWLRTFLLSEHVPIVAVEYFIDDLVRFGIDLFDASDCLVISPHV